MAKLSLRLQGYITLTCLVIVLAFAFWMAADILHVRALAMEVKRVEEQLSLNQELDSALIKYLADLADKMNSPASIYGDQVIQELDGVSLSCLDLSSRINLNWIDAQLLSIPGIAIYFEKDPSIFFEERLKNGPIQNPILWQHYFKPTAYSANFTLFGPIDLNSCDLLVIEKLMKERPFSFASSNIRAVLQDYRQRKELIKPEKLIFIIGAEEEATQLFTSTAPLNLYSVPQSILEALINNPGWEIENRTAVLEKLKSLRSSTSAKPQELPELLGLAKNHKLFNYLGTQSTVFLVEARQSGSRAQVVVMFRPLELRTAQGEIGPWKIMHREYSHDE